MMGRTTLLRLVKDRRGAAAVEFAFIAPVLILMYFGVVEFTQGMIVQRRVSHVASTAADLTSRVAQVSTSDTTDIFRVGRTIIYPLNPAPLRMRLTSITSDASNVSRVDWSDASNWSSGALAPNSLVTVPSGVIGANQSVVMAEVEYTYTSPLRFLLPNGILMSHVYYLRPRISNVVTHS